MLAAMIRTFVLGALLLSCHSLQFAAEVELGDPVVVVPMSHEHGHITVDVTLDGKGPFLFQLDTYASGQAYVDDDFAEAMGLPVVGTTRNSDGRNVMTRDLVRVDRLELGGAVFTDVRTMVDDYDWIGTRGGRKVQGLLGFELFRELLLTLDYPKSRIVLEAGALDGEDSHVMAYVSTTGSPDVQVVVGGVELLVGIDTGHDGSLMLHTRDADELALAGPLEKVGTARTAYTTFDLFSQELEGPVGLAGHELTGIDPLFSEGASGRLLGAELLKPFAVTFDQERMLVRFAKPER
jgi:hypothetical protein